MSYIIRTGNLAATPKLEEGERGPYCYARVIVSDGERQEDGTWQDGPAIAYDVAVSGSTARELVAVAEACGNIRLTFTGFYRVSEYRTAQGETRLSHRVRADEVAVSLKGQAVRVEPRTEA